MLADKNYSPIQGNVFINNGYLTYTPQAPLNQWILCFWQLNVPNGQFHYRSLPDNCVDLVLSLNDGKEAFIIAPFSTSHVFEIKGPQSYFGIRFQVLGHQGIIQSPVGDWPETGVVDDASLLIDINLHQALMENCLNDQSFIKRCQFIDFTKTY